MGLIARWPDDAVDRLKTLVDDGLSAAQISRALIKEGYDYSRQAVIGKAHRIDHHLHNEPYRHGSGKRSASKPRVVKSIIEVIVDASNFLGAVGELPIAGLCHYVIGDLATLQACGHPVGLDKKGRKTCYCDYHQTIVHQKPGTKGNGGYIRPIAPAAIAFL